MTQPNLWGGTQKMDFIYKKLCICCYMFKLRSPSKYSSFDTIHLSRLFHCSKQFLNLLILMPFSASAVVSPPPHQQDISLWGLFHPEKQTKKSHLGEDWVNGEGGTWGHAVCGQKLLNTQRHVGRCARKSPIVMWANALKSLQKEFPEAQCSLSQQHQLVHWYRWVPRTLT